MLGTYFFTVNRFITRSTQKQLNDTYNEILVETSDTLENLLWNLTLTSSQILDNVSIQDTLMSYQTETDLYTKQLYYSKLLDDITILTLANMDIALMYIYDNETNEYIYSSLPASGNQFFLQPVLYENSAFSFCGPCRSQSVYVGNSVIILNRTEFLPNGRSITLSIESGYYSMDNPFRSAKNKSAYLAFTDDDGNFIYDTFSEGMDAAEVLSNLFSKNPDYHFLKKEMSQGWSIYVIIPDSVYTYDYYIHGIILLFRIYFQILCCFVYLMSPI